jgi:hypothetical protein
MKPPENPTAREIVRNALEELEQFVRTTPAKPQQNVVPLSANARACSGEGSRSNLPAAEKVAAHGSPDGDATPSARVVSDTLETH